MAYGDRKSQGWHSARGSMRRVISIDGTLKRPCMVIDISHSGAKIELGDDTSRFDLAEFFLLMSTRGAVHRRCRIVRRYGNEIGITFVRGDAKR